MSLVFYITHKKCVKERKINSILKGTLTVQWFYAKNKNMEK